MGRRRQPALRSFLTSSSCSDGQSHEGNEEEVSEQDCKGSHGQSPGVPWIQGEDRRRLESFFLDKEQARKGREQEAVSSRQEERLDDCCPEGKEGIENQGLRRSQEGL